MLNTDNNQNVYSEQEIRASALTDLTISWGKYIITETNPLIMKNWNRLFKGHKQDAMTGDNGRTSVKGWPRKAPVKRGTFKLIFKESKRQKD